MPKRSAWKKRLCIGLLLLLLCYMLLEEFGGALPFFAGIFGLSALWVFGRTRWTERRNRLRREKAEAAREADRAAAAARRLEAYRAARYAPEERERVEARLEQVLGPIADRDLNGPGDVPDIDVALIPPTEGLPFWKAATVGAGACALEAGGYQIAPLRVELAMALPPDWDAGDRRPCRVLRDAARRFLITEGFVGYGSVYRGISLLSAGFAGAIPDDEFPGLPEIGPAAMPGNLAVRFYWLIPLLKPELDYFHQRGPRGLERRFPASRPWADPNRTPLADPVTWFREDIAPFIWSEDGERFCLGLETGRFHQDLFLLSGLQGTGRDWERLVREYLRKYQPCDGPFVEYACEERYFFAASGDREIMERLALGLSDLLRDNRPGARSLLAPDGRRG